jgi:hypothetical protein
MHFLLYLRRIRLRKVNTILRRAGKLARKRPAVLLAIIVAGFYTISDLADVSHK